MLFPRKDEVVEIHRQMIEKFGGMPGIRDESRDEVEARFARWVVEPSQDAKQSDAAGRKSSGQDLGGWMPKRGYLPLGAAPARLFG